MLKKTYLIVFVCCFQFGFSQEIKFGKVTKEELLEKSYLQDESANAVVLFKKQITYFDSNTATNELVTEIHERIKIYNKEGFDYATEYIDLFKSRSDREMVGKIKAYTYNIENNEIIKTGLEKDQIFETEIRYNYNQVKFTMPNIKEGSVIEYKYKVISPFIWNIDEFRFQYDIPIKKLEAEIRTPDGFNFKETQKGYVPFYGKKGNSYNEMNATKYSLTHVPALKAESYVDNIDNYRAGVMFELVSIQIPGVFYQDYASSWGEVAKTIGSTDDYEKKLDKTKNFDIYLDDILKGKTDQIEKMKVVFQYVKDHIKWNNMDGKYFYNGIKKALIEKKGNAADINLTLVAMLRYAGINANPLVISTKDNIIPVFPTVDRLNYVIAYAVINDERYFLDATDEFSDINILPIKDYNWKGILIDNNNMKWNSISIREPDKAIEQYLINATLNEEGSIKGKFNSRYTKHSAFKFRENYKDQDLEGYIANKEESLKNIEISNYETKNTDSYEGYVTESYEFLYDNAADVVGDKIYINPFLFLKIEENPFKLDKREFPIDFGFPFSDKYSISIAVPEGYAAESIPNPVLLKIPDDLGSFRFIPKVIGNKIQLVVSFDINKAIISADKYLFLKEFFNQMITKEAEQIVLTRI